MVPGAELNNSGQTQLVASRVREWIQLCLLPVFDPPFGYRKSQLQQAKIVSEARRLP